jgi:hypothetical protein
MKLLLTTLLLACSLQAFTPSQVSVINLAIKLGKPYNLSNTLAGIVVVESSAGKYKVNPTTEDYGVSGINIKSVLSRMGVPDTYLNRSRYATYLVTEDRFAIRAALAELIYWRDSRNRKSWYRMVGSYNQGHYLRNNTYAVKVANAIKLLKTQNIID